MKILKYISLWTLILLSFSCKKAEERKCFKSTGNNVEITHYVPHDFDTLFLYDNLIYNLIQDSVNKVILRGGENLLPLIQIDASNNGLSIKNNNTCNFLRSYKSKITAEVHFKEITFLHSEVTEQVKTLDTIRATEFRLFIRNGAGSTDLTIETGYLVGRVDQGYGDFTLKGNAIFGFFHCNTNSFCDTKDLHVKNWIKVVSNTAGDMVINADQSEVNAEIHRDGNIKYVGTPSQINLKNKGTGELIDCNDE